LATRTLVGFYCLQW